MRRSPIKKTAHSVRCAWLLTLCTLLLVLLPTVSAMNVRDGARDMHRMHLLPRLSLRMENGKVTDRDGIIGNGSYGADRDLHHHGGHHGERRSHTTASIPEASVAASATWLPGAPQGGVSGAASRGRTLPDEGGTADGGTTQPDTGMPGENMQDHNGTSGQGTTADRPDSDADNEDGVIGDDNAENGLIEQESPAENGIASDDVAEGDPTTGDVPGADAAENATEDGNATARSILPWVIGIIAALAAVLVVLALIPRQRRSR